MSHCIENPLLVNSTRYNSNMTTLRKVSSTLWYVFDVALLTTIPKTYHYLEVSISTRDIQNNIVIYLCSIWSFGHGICWFSEYLGLCAVCCGCYIDDFTENLTVRMSPASATTGCKDGRRVCSIDGETCNQKYIVPPKKGGGKSFKICSQLLWDLLKTLTNTACQVPHI